MNKQGVNGIEWTNWTWNPVTGCLHGCEYCYARRSYERFGRSFYPAFWPERLGQIMQPKAGDRVFVGSTTDMMGEWVPAEWINEVRKACELRPDVTFQWLSKNPALYAEFNPWPANCWLGATATNWMDAEKQERATRGKVGDAVRFLSLEPMDCSWPDEQHVGVFGYDWVIIGAMTGPMAKLDDWQISSYSIDAVLAACDYWEIPVFMKSSLRPYWGGELYQQWPIGYKCSTTSGIGM